MKRRPWRAAESCETKKDDSALSMRPVSRFLARGAVFCRGLANQLSYEGRSTERDKDDEDDISCVLCMVKHGDGSGGTGLQ
jgi:hypothetical protein